MMALSCPNQDRALYFGLEAFNVQHTRTSRDSIVLTAKGSSLLANLVVLFWTLSKSIDIHPRNQDIEQLFTDTISSHVGHRSSDIIKLCIDQIEVQTGRLVGSVAYIEMIEDGTLTS